MPPAVATRRVVLEDRGLVLEAGAVPGVAGRGGEDEVQAFDTGADEHDLARQIDEHPALGVEGRRERGRQRLGGHQPLLLLAARLHVGERDREPGRQPECAESLAGDRAGDAVDQQLADAVALEQLVELALLVLHLAGGEHLVAVPSRAVDVVEAVVDAHVEQLADLEHLAGEAVLGHDREHIDGVVVEPVGDLQNALVGLHLHDTGRVVHVERHRGGRRGRPGGSGRRCHRRIVVDNRGCIRFAGTRRLVALFDGRRGDRWRRECVRADDTHRVVGRDQAP